jgi:hypothetical protein
MKDIKYKSNNWFPNRNYSKANHLNVVAFDKPSDTDGADKENFEGLQYNPDNDPAYAGDEPPEGAIMEEETPCLGTVRLEELNRVWCLHALRKEDSDKQVANALARGVRDTYEGQPGYHTSRGTKLSPPASLPTIPKVPVGTYWRALTHRHQGAQIYCTSRFLTTIQSSQATIMPKS